MKKVFILLFTLCFCLTINAQETSIDSDKMFINNTLTFKNTKQKIIDEFGENYKRIEPNYECGFYSKEEQGVDYFQLKYKIICFIGNEKEGYIPESIHLN